ncbi:hypothetical protein [Halomarina ordinaria]|uniref:Uncharacterized protein n=1 Tax=Halomarina ordinaria TaxID=3033939 RepID=A0ABD5UE99_9EURY|nr:hypothetical protein [Halomarina sp. PSRA2]
MSHSSDTQPAMAYPTKTQYARWKAHAADYEMSVSEFMQAMIEAGLKKFEVAVTPDEPAHELREQRNDLKAELDHARKRIQRLEDQVHGGERRTIRRYVEQNPGVSYEEIVQQVIDTAPSRVSRHLDDLEGEVLQVRTADGTYRSLDIDSPEGGL